jgi:hypothetical protein
MAMEREIFRNIVDGNAVLGEPDFESLYEFVCRVMNRNGYSGSDANQQPKANDQFQDAAQNPEPAK